MTFDGGALGVAVLILIAGLLGTAFAGLSNALALVARHSSSCWTFSARAASTTKRRAAEVRALRFEDPE